MRARFGRFVLDSETRQLVRGGEQIHVSPKAFDLLCLLVARRPTVVPKATVFSEIWPDSFVVEANLTVLVGEIRRALGDDAQSPRFIRTSHGVGYAFCGEVTEEAEESAVAGSRPRCWLTWKDRTFVLSEGDNLVGRDPGCRVWLDRAGVSRRHARIHVAPETGRAVLEDLESTNGTFVGRQPVSGQTTLQDSDVITVGSVDLRFRAWSDGPAPTRRLKRRS